MLVSAANFPLVGGTESGACDNQGHLRSDHLGHPWKERMHECVHLVCVCLPLSSNLSSWGLCLSEDVGGGGEEQNSGPS